MVIPKLIEMKISSKYLNGYLDDVIRPLVLILPKMSLYVKTFKDNKLMSSCIDEDYVGLRVKT